MSLVPFLRFAAGAPGIRRGCPLANSAGTYEFARGHPTTSCAPAVAAEHARDLSTGFRARRLGMTAEHGR